MNSASKKGSLLKQTGVILLYPVRFSVLLVLAEEFIPRRRLLLNFTQSRQDANPCLRAFA
jgi:hypothetical protein